MNIHIGRERKRHVLKNVICKQKHRIPSRFLLGSKQMGERLAFEPVIHSRSSHPNTHNTVAGARTLYF